VVGCSALCEAYAGQCKVIYKNLVIISKLGTGFENEAQIFKGTETIQALECGQIRPFTILEDSKFMIKK
jgi:hypothetical protein